MEKSVPPPDSAPPERLKKLVDSAKAFPTELIEHDIDSPVHNSMSDDAEFSAEVSNARKLDVVRLFGHLGSLVGVIGSACAQDVTPM